MRGGEKVLEAFLELFPHADLWTLVARPKRVSPAIARRITGTSLLQYIPGGPEHYRWFLPFFPFFMRRLDLSKYDLVLSCSSACAKWVRPKSGGRHFCYCFTPMRYLWDFFDTYFERPETPRWLGFAARMTRRFLQHVDLESNAAVTEFIADSHEVEKRIFRLYGRSSVVIHPPVDVERFYPEPHVEKKEFLVLSALVPYKRVDLAVRVFSRRGWPLRVVGEGGEQKYLRRLAGKSVIFHGRADDAQVPRLYAAAKALIFPGHEDFGIVPLEALASGCPVIAYAKGGVMDYLQDGRTGFLFAEQTEEALEAAVERFLAAPGFDAQALRETALRFSRDRFLSELRAFFAARKVL